MSEGGNVQGKCPTHSQQQQNPVVLLDVELTRQATSASQLKYVICNIITDFSTVCRAVDIFQLTGLRLLCTA